MKPQIGYTNVYLSPWAYTGGNSITRNLAVIMGLILRVTVSKSAHEMAGPEMTEEINCVKAFSPIKPTKNQKKKMSAPLPIKDLEKAKSEHYYPTKHPSLQI